MFAGPATTLPDPASNELDAIWFGGALPLAPKPFREALAEKGRLVTFLGPRFDDQDLVCITKTDGECRERTLGRAKAPVIAGRYGWLRRLPVKTPPQAAE